MILLRFLHSEIFVEAARPVTCAWAGAFAVVRESLLVIETGDFGDANTFFQFQSPAFAIAGSLAVCVSRGTHLTTIDDPSEAAFLAALVPAGFWSAADKSEAGTKLFVCEDVRARSPDPGDACDPCPNDYDPKDSALTSIADAGADADASHADACP